MIFCWIIYLIATARRWNHHNLSTVASRPEWLTLTEGSRSYIDAVIRDFPSDRIFINKAVRTVKNNDDGRVVLSLQGGQEETFDHVIIATHGDQALELLGAEATAQERDVLSCFKTSRNEVVLHSDLTHMPKRRKAWCSWNFMTLSPHADTFNDTVSLTYYMNTLQHIPHDQFGHVLVTLNPLREPDPALTQGRFVYSHPLYTSKAVEAQKRLGHIQNKRGISYAGAWTNYGFHEDGFSSGLKVAQDHLGARLPFDLVDASFSRGKMPKLGISDYLLRMFIILIQWTIVRPLELLVGIDRPGIAVCHKDGKQS